MKKLFVLLSLLAGLAFQPLAHAVEESEVPEKMRTELGLYLTPTEAYELKQEMGDRALFIDVRTAAEVAYTGTPTVMDLNIPMMFFDRSVWDENRQTYGVRENPDFTSAIESVLFERDLTNDSPIILMCRSGTTRSTKGANLLKQLGFTKVYTVINGFEGPTAKSGPNKGQRVVSGWKNDGLPWSYKLGEERAFGVE